MSAANISFQSTISITLHSTLKIGKDVNYWPQEQTTYFDSSVFSNFKNVVSPTEQYNYRK